jgi:hypothetical protein
VGDGGGLDPGGDAEPGQDVGHVHAGGLGAGPHCRNRDDIFAMFRARMASGTRIGFDELRSTPSKVLVTARAADFGAVVSVSSFQGRRITSVKDDPWMEAAEAALAGPRRPPTER